MGRLFGTDGVRGRANADLTPELAMSVARASPMCVLCSHTTALGGWGPVSLRVSSRSRASTMCTSRTFHDSAEPCTIAR